MPLPLRRRVFAFISGIFSTRRREDAKAQQQAIDNMRNAVSDPPCAAVALRPGGRPSVGCVARSGDRPQRVGIPSGRCALPGTATFECVPPQDPTAALPSLMTVEIPQNTAASGTLQMEEIPYDSIMARQFLVQASASDEAPWEGLIRGQFIGPNHFAALSSSNTEASPVLSRAIPIEEGKGLYINFRYQVPQGNGVKLELQRAGNTEYPKITVSAINTAIEDEEENKEFLIDFALSVFQYENDAWNETARKSGTFQRDPNRTLGEIADHVWYEIFLVVHEDYVRALVKASNSFLDFQPGADLQLPLPSFEPQPWPDHIQFTPEGLSGGYSRFRLDDMCVLALSDAL